MQDYRINATSRLEINLTWLKELKARYIIFVSYRKFRCINYTIVPEMQVDC